MTWEPPVPLSISSSFPLAGPFAEGRKVTFIVHPLLTANGLVQLLVWLNSPTIAILLIKRGALPTLVSTIDCAGLEVPTACEPNVSFDEEHATVGALDHNDAVWADTARVLFELNCIKCHAISGAAGGVGPDLSALGLSSPVDYVVNSILIPDQAIKE